MPSMCSKIVSLFVVGLVQPCNGNAFLRKSDDSRGGSMVSKSGIEKALLAEVQGVTGKGTIDADLPAIEAALEPMWLALPKNELGNLGNAQVSYALHRFFVQRHGWYIEVLDGKMKNESQTVTELIEELVEEEVPAFLLARFEEAFGKSGMTHKELAIFAATLEHLIHDGNERRLQAVYKMMNMSTTQLIGEANSTMAMDLYVMGLLMPTRQARTGVSSKDKIATLDNSYPAWKQTQAWLRQLRAEEMAAMSDVASDGLTYKQMESICEQVSFKFGAFQNQECQQQKKLLLKSEEGSTGRILLSNFYKHALDGTVGAKEDAAYLRHQGVLDESKAGEARVIVSNYILSRGNCLADTGLYSICCINECESSMAHLEKALAAPEGSPESIASIVRNLLASTGQAALSESMVSRLDMIALRHGGMVPLHGRLFAQWLHFAMPRECPYPHVTGTVERISKSDWQTQTGKSNLDVKHIKKLVQAAPETKPDHSELTQWSHDEEILFMPTAPSRPFRTLFSACFKYGGMLAILGAGALAAGEFAKRAGTGAGLLRPQKEHII